MFQIIADSGCDLRGLSHISPDALFARAPLRIIAGNKEYVDTFDLDTRQMLDEVYAFKGKTGSACPSPEEWAQHFRAADENYAIPISSALSGSYASAVIARDMVLAESPEKKIYIFDVHTAGSEMSLLAEEIARLASSGMPFEMVCSEAERYVQRTGLLFLLNSLDNLVKNGRVSKVAGMTAKLLNIKVLGVATPEGQVGLLHKCRGAEKTYATVVHEMRQRGFCGGKVIIGHAHQPEGAHRLKERILAEFPGSPVVIMPNSGLCCYYAEDGGMIIGFEKAL